ncbi:MAG: hypothetical protein KIS86_04705 [Devosia sp.]|nr:hypothetical protein [Devosia sp.]
MAEPIEYEADASFIARVKQIVEIGPIKYLPRDEMKVKGRLLNKIVGKYGESVIDYANPA